MRRAIVMCVADALTVRVRCGARTVKHQKIRQLGLVSTIDEALHVHRANTAVVVSAFAALWTIAESKPHRSPPSLPFACYAHRFPPHPTRTFEPNTSRVLQAR